MLDLDFASLAYQIINFVALLALLYYFLFKPLRRKLHERQQAVAELLQEARDREMQASRLQAEWEERMSALQQEADDTLARAQKEATQKRTEILEETRIRVERLTENMRNDLLRERDEILAQNYEAILDTIIDLSGNVVQSVTTRRTHDDLVQNFCASIYRLPQEDINQYRAAMAGRHPVAVVVTPVALTADQTKTLSDTLSSLVDRQIELQVRVEPQLVAGIQVRIADKLVDNSIRQQLSRIRDRVRQDLTGRMGESA